MNQYKILEILKNGLQKNEQIKSAILYGSFARQSESPNSDIDLAILVKTGFENSVLIRKLNELLSQFDILHIINVELRNKLVVYFQNIPKLEITILYNIEEIKRNYLGSNIPVDLINTTILFDKTNSVIQFLKQSTINNKKDTKRIVSNLINKFVYEFENCSYYHSRSDAYKFYFFYNIAFHTAIQLKYLSKGKTKYYFLPKNFAVKNFTTDEQRDDFYQLAGSTYLRDANNKKRNLLDFFFSTISSIKHAESDKIKRVLEKIFERDYLWNFRDIAKFNPSVKNGIIFRTSSPTAYQNEAFLLKYLKVNSIKTIIDLRAEQEIRKDPYLKNFIKNYKYIKAPFDPWKQPEWFKKKYHYGTNTEIAYRFFVIGCKDKVKKIFDAIYEAEGAVLIHCVAGKDRTGFVILLINLLLETDYNIILTDYLASELDTHKDKLDIYYDYIKKEGGIIKYLKSCGLSETKLNLIKKKLLK